MVLSSQSHTCGACNKTRRTAINEQLTDQQHTGQIGLFYACYQFALKGWQVLLTTRNTKGADIFIVKGETKLGIEVKSIEKDSNVGVGTGGLAPSVDFWLVVRNTSEKQDAPSYTLYLIPQKDIEQAVDDCIRNDKRKNYTDLVTRTVKEEDGKEPKIRYWIDRNKYLLPKGHQYHNVWERLDERVRADTCLS